MFSSTTPKDSVLSPDSVEQMPTAVAPRVPSGPARHLADHELRDRCLLRRIGPRNADLELKRLALIGIVESFRRWM